jgi:hypothetical protein
VFLFCFKEKKMDKDTVSESIEIKDGDGFITQVIKKCQQAYGTTWKMTTLAYLMLAIACRNNPGVAKYILNEINPKPG